MPKPATVAKMAMVMDDGIARGFGFRLYFRDSLLQAPKGSEWKYGLILVPISAELELLYLWQPLELSQLDTLKLLRLKLPQ